MAGAPARSTQGPNLDHDEYEDDRCQTHGEMGGLGPCHRTQPKRDIREEQKHSPAGHDAFVLGRRAATADLGVVARLDPRRVRGGAVRGVRRVFARADDQPFPDERGADELGRAVRLRARACWAALPFGASSAAEPFPDERGADELGRAVRLRARACWAALPFDASSPAFVRSSEAPFAPSAVCLLAWDDDPFPDDRGADGLGRVVGLRARARSGGLALRRVLGGGIPDRGLSTFVSRNDTCGKRPLPDVKSVAPGGRRVRGRRSAPSFRCA